MRRVHQTFLVGMCLLLLLCGCTKPCETQSFYFAQDTITFPTDVKTIMKKYQDVESAVNSTIPVSYTHLDVYKRQGQKYLVF